MDQIVIEATGSTPQVIFDINNRQFEIIGCSRPENVIKFYMPIIDWLDSFAEKSTDYISYFENERAVFNIKLSYFNSASAKFILDILLLLNKIYKSGVALAINWHYEPGDEDMLDVGEELAEMVEFDFNYIESK